MRIGVPSAEIKGWEIDARKPTRDDLLKLQNVLRLSTREINQLLTLSEYSPLNSSAPRTVEPPSSSQPPTIHDVLQVPLTDLQDGLNSLTKLVQEKTSPGDPEEITTELTNLRQTLASFKESYEQKERERDRREKPMFFFGLFSGGALGFIVNIATGSLTPLSWAVAVIVVTATGVAAWAALRPAKRPPIC